jgi:hypothetical protein
MIILWNLVLIKSRGCNTPAIYVAMNEDTPHCSEYMVYYSSFIYKIKFNFDKILFLLILLIAKFKNRILFIKYFMPYIKKIDINKKYSH